MELKNIAIIGASGVVGRAITSRLQATNLHTTIIQRPSSQYKATSTANLKTIVTEYTLPSLTTALAGQDALLCCLSGSAITLASQNMLLDAAVAAGVKVYFASEFVSNILAPHFALFPPAVVGEKIAVRRELERRGEKGEIAWMALNGGPFFDMWLMRGPAGISFDKHTATIYGNGNNPSCWTPLPVMASAVVNMLQTPEPVLNRVTFICGVRDVTQNKLLEAVEAETGHKFAVEHVDLQPIKKDALQKLESGDLKAAVRGLAINFNFGEGECMTNFWESCENELAGVKVTDLREAVRLSMNGSDSY